MARTNTSTGKGRAKRHSGGRGTRPSPTPPPAGPAVTWKRGAGLAVGKLVALFRSQLTKNIKGAEIAREAAPATPAARVATGDNKKALESARDPKRAPKKMSVKKTSRNA